MAFLSELKQFFIDSFSSPVYQDGVLYFIIEELPNPRDSGVFKILCGSTQIALDGVTLDEPGVVIANELIGLHAATIRKYPYQKIEYVNIAPWAQEKIEARMARIGLKIQLPSICATLCESGNQSAQNIVLPVHMSD